MSTERESIPKIINSLLLYIAMLFKMDFAKSNLNR